MCETKPKTDATPSNPHHANGNGVSSNGNGVSSNGNGVTNHASHHPLPKDNDNAVLNFDHGDPTLFQTYWTKQDKECSLTIKASDLISYFPNHEVGDFMFQMPEFTEAVHRVHRVAGNAVTEGRYIVGGTGSTMLYMLALRALASSAVNSSNKKKRIPVVCAEPYYQLYGEAIHEWESELYEWHGDAKAYEHEGGPYIEVVTSPNNPDGAHQKPVVNKEGGLLIHDLAYYWPQYTPITAPADYDIMLFTLSKATGHAGSRVGWAIVKDLEIAKKMLKQMRLLCIGICQEGQLRAAKILEYVSNSYEDVAHDLISPDPKVQTSEKLFEFGYRILSGRWNKLRDVLKNSEVFSIPNFPIEHCNFQGKLSQASPSFAWMECKTGDAAKTLAEVKILGRSGSRFGTRVSGKYIRVSMLGTDESFNIFLERLSRLS